MSRIAKENMEVAHKFNVEAKKAPFLSIMGPADEKVWEKPGFDAAAMPLHAILCHSGHPIWKMDEFYNTMHRNGMHFTYQEQATFYGACQDALISNHFCDRLVDGLQTVVKDNTSMEGPAPSLTVTPGALARITVAKQQEVQAWCRTAEIIAEHVADTIEKDEE